MNTLQIQTSKTDYRTIAVRVLAITLAGMLLYAATKKIMNLEAFAAHIIVLPYMQTWMTYILSGIVMLAEYGLAVMLLYQPMRRTLYFVVIGLMLIYTAYIYAVLNYALTLPCSCQGAFKSLSWQQHYLVNLGVLLVAVGILLLIKKTKGHDNLRNK